MIKNNRNLEVFNCDGVKVFYGPRGSGKSKKLTEYMELHTLEKEDFNNKFLEVTTKSLMINMETVKTEEYNNDFLMGYNVFTNKKDDITERKDYDIFIDEAENYLRKIANKDIIFCLDNLDIKQKIKFIVSYLKKEFPNLKAISITKLFNYDFINENNRLMDTIKPKYNIGTIVYTSDIYGAISERLVEKIDYEKCQNSFLYKLTGDPYCRWFEEDVFESKYDCIKDIIENRWNNLVYKNPDIEKIIQETLEFIGKIVLERCNNKEGK